MRFCLILQRPDRIGDFLDYFFFLSSGDAFKARRESLRIGGFFYFSSFPVLALLV